MKPVNVFTVRTETDPEDPPGYQAEAAKLGPMIGAAMIGGSVYVLAPGESVCPYHFEFGSEEWLLVLEGGRRCAGPPRTASSRKSWSRATRSASRPGRPARTR